LEGLERDLDQAIGTEKCLYLGFERNKMDILVRCGDNIREFRRNCKRPSAEAMGKKRGKKGHTLLKR